MSIDIPARAICTRAFPSSTLDSRAALPCISCIPWIPGIVNIPGSST
ncbi:MAG: hypothetical protein GYA24_08780 [Candidatus Lokiarchaeota archaeon]|nr:hypothetical protein [Candidatus Lokiarchaeota archaeon]